MDDSNAIVISDPEKDIKRLKRRLKPIERRFCEEYISNLRNATQAYLTAYAACRKGGKVQHNSAATMGFRLLRRDDVQAYIAALEAQIEDQINISGGEMVAKFRAIADDPDAASADRLRALENISKLAGLYSDAATNNTHIMLITANPCDLTK